MPALAALSDFDSGRRAPDRVRRKRGENVAVRDDSHEPRSMRRARADE